MLTQVTYWYLLFACDPISNILACTVAIAIMLMIEVPIVLEIDFNFIFVLENILIIYAAFTLCTMIAMMYTHYI